MHLLITLDDELLNDLIELTEEANPRRAVELAAEHFVRDAKLEQLRHLKGKISILSNEELEQAYAEAAKDEDFGWDATLLDGLEDQDKR